MQHDWDKYFDTETEYWKKIQEIYKENDNYPKIVVSGRNLHHKFMRSFSRFEGTEIDNDKENLVSLSEGDHFLVHYYLWKCTKTGYRNRTALAVRYMYKKAVKYLTDEIAELIAKEWTSIKFTHSEETKRKMSEAKKSNHWNKGRVLGPRSEEVRKKISETEKGKIITEEAKKKMSKSHKGKPSAKKGKPLSEETKRKMSESHKGQTPWNKGKKCPQISKSLEGLHPNISNEERERRRNRMIELNKKQKGKKLEEK